MEVLPRKLSLSSWRNMGATINNKEMMLGLMTVILVEIHILQEMVMLELMHQLQ